MKLKKVKYILFIWFICIFFVQNSTGFPSKKNATATPNYPSVFHLNDVDKEWVENKLKSMTTKEKVAQMVMPWVMGNDRSQDTLELVRIKQLITEYKVGGFAYFQGDINNERKDIIDMQILSKIPLLIASDF